MDYIEGVRCTRCSEQGRTQHGYFQRLQLSQNVHHAHDMICKTLTCLNVIIVVFLKTKIGKDNLWKPERVV